MTTIYTSKPLPKRRANDFYPTPAPIVARCVGVLPMGAYTHALDPGCGTGVWGQQVLRRWPGALVDGCEIRDVERPEGYRYLFGGDFRLGDYADYDLVIGNPPYCYAEQFVRLGLKALNEGGHLIFLLRLAFLGGKGRARGLYRRFPLKACYVVGRVSFSGDGKTDANEYALFHWQKGYKGEAALRWLPE